MKRNEIRMALAVAPAFWQLQARKKRYDLIQHLCPEEMRKYFDDLVMLADGAEDRWLWHYQEDVKALVRDKLREFISSLSESGRDGLELLASLLGHKSRFVRDCVWDGFRLFIEQQVARVGQDPTHVGDVLRQDHLKIIAEYIRGSQSFVVEYTPPTGPIADSGDFSYMNGAYVPEGTPVFLGTSPRLFIRQGTAERTHNTVGQADG